MDVHRVLLVAVVCLGFAGPTAYAQNDEEVAAEAAQARAPAKPWRHVRGFGRVLDLRNPPVVIDQPGHYAIDRNWEIPRAAVEAAAPELIKITASGVTLDLNGFAISADISALPVATLLVITASGVEVRNGALTACCDGATAVQTTAGPTLRNLSIYSHETMTFGDGTTLKDSSISARVTLQFAGGANLERNTISCNRGSRCVRLLGDGNQVTDNSLTLSQGGGIAIVGDRNVVANNVIDGFFDVDGFEAFVVEGDNNVVRANTVSFGDIKQFSTRPVFGISGTANTLDGNIAAPFAPGGRALIGMQFTADGNYYGGNRMAAQTPFALGGTVQTDWGGNVGY